MKTNNIYRIITFLIFMLVSVYFVEAQCPMCKIAAESNLKTGGNAGKGLNAGIFYLLLIPYSLVGGVALYWYKNRKKE